MSDISIYRGHTPPANPGGITIVIDVIRAFTTAHYAFGNGIQRIYLVATAAEALALKQQDEQLLLAGEVRALPIEGFDFGNSPYEIANAELAGKTLVHRTTNGVIATLACRDSAQVLVASLVNADATAAWVKQHRQPAQPILLVASHPTGDEDFACAEYLRGLLGGPGISFEEAAERTLNARAALKFREGKHSRLRWQDIEMAACRGAPATPALGVVYDQVPWVKELPVAATPSAADQYLP